MLNSIFSPIILKTAINVLQALLRRLRVQYIDTYFPVGTLVPYYADMPSMAINCGFDTISKRCILSLRKILENAPDASLVEFTIKRIMGANKTDTTYDVELVVTSDNGCTDTVVYQYTPLEIPVASFSSISW